MAKFTLRGSLAKWRQRLAYRRRKHAFYHDESQRPDPERKALAMKWHKLAQEAAAMVARREKQIGTGKVAKPVDPILSSSWGYHPGVHDGVDLITEADDTLYAICDARVIDVRSSGWWGKGARASSGHPISDGDGIIQLECLTDAGPFVKGMHFGYGHAEKASVKVGQTVKAGQPIGRAGFANAWHIHFMANGGGTSRGVGDRDPMPYVLYAIAKGTR